MWRSIRRSIRRSIQRNTRRSTRQGIRSTRIWLGPGIVLGLFSGRVFSEQWARLTGSGLGLAAAVTVTLVITLVITLFLSRLSPQKWLWPKWLWPAFWLLVYVFYREPNPQIALLTAVIAALSAIQIIDGQWRVSGKFPVSPFSALFLAAAFLVVYIATLAPDVLTADNGEFQLIAAQLGVAHPPGFPLYTMLAHLMTRLPLPASSAYKVSLFSTITSTLTLVLVCWSAYLLTRRPAAGITAAVALGTSTTFWAQATTANIRSLTGFFAALMLYALIRFQKRYQDEKAGAEGAQADRYLVLFALALGFGLTHHVSLIFMALICGIFIVAVDPRFIRTPRRWLRPFLASLLGLLPLLYLPWRAKASVRGASAGLATLDGFLNYVLALGFRGDFFYFIEPGILWQRFKVMANVMTFQFHPFLLWGMALGLLLMLWRQRRLALLLGGSFAIHAFITAAYRAPQTVEYMLPAYIPAVLGLGYAVGEAGQLAVENKGWLTMAVWQSFVAATLLLAIYQGIERYPSYAALHQDTTARDYAQPLLEQASPGSVILADWHWATPLWYLQEIEGQRPDVEIRYVAPAGEAYAVTWARRITQEYENGRDVIATHFQENAYAQLPPSEPVGQAFLFPQAPRTALPPAYTPLDLVLDERVQVLGYHLESARVEIGQEAIFSLAWQPVAEFQPPLTLFAHLVGGDGRLVAQQDLSVQPLFAEALSSITVTQFRLTPHPGAAPGDFTIMVGAYAGAPDPNEDRIGVAALTITAMSRPPATQNGTYLTVASPRLRRLIGYDWDHTLPPSRRLYLHWQTEQGYQTEVRDDATADSLDLPPYLGPWGVESRRWPLDDDAENSHYVPFGQGIVWTGQTLSGRTQAFLAPGQTIALPQIFLSGRPVFRDLKVAVRLIGFEEDGFTWAWADLGSDGVPALGAIPTLKWIEGSKVRDLHFVTAADTAVPGQEVAATLLLYDAFTNRPLPILDGRIASQLPWVPLGSTRIGRPSEQQ